MLAWVIPFIAGSIWYYHTVPSNMLANLGVAMLTQKFMQWHQTLSIIMAVTIGVIIVVAVVGAIKPKLIPSVLLVIPFVLGLWLLGHFERVREFIRKPYVIADYMYSNGVKLDELPVFQRDGVLPYANYVTNHRVTADNMVAAGRDVLVVTCSRCHTTRGINSMMTKFTNLYGNDPWDKDAVLAFIHTMHMTRTYMPPFPGSDKEAEALVAYLKQMQVDHKFILGAQNEWTVKPAPTTSQATGP